MPNGLWTFRHNFRFSDVTRLDAMHTHYYWRPYLLDLYIRLSAPSYVWLLLRKPAIVGCVGVIHLTTNHISHSLSHYIGTPCKFLLLTPHLLHTKMLMASHSRPQFAFIGIESVMASTNCWFCLVSKAIYIFSVLLYQTQYSHEVQCWVEGSSVTVATICLCYQ